jgi:hypothetical protein
MTFYFNLSDFHSMILVGLRGNLLPVNSDTQSPVARNDICILGVPDNDLHSIDKRKVRFDSGQDVIWRDGFCSVLFILR